MARSHILDNHIANKQPQQFKADDKEHQLAFLSLFIEGRQHESLRFLTDRPFSGSPQYMMMALSLSHCSEMLEAKYNMTVEEALTVMRNRDVDSVMRAKTERLNNNVNLGPVFKEANLGLRF